MTFSMAHLRNIKKKKYLDSFFFHFRKRQRMSRKDNSYSAKKYTFSQQNINFVVDEEQKRVLYDKMTNIEKKNDTDHFMVG